MASLSHPVWPTTADLWGIVFFLVEKQHVMNKHTASIKGGYDSCIEAGYEYWFVRVIFASQKIYDMYYIYYMDRFCYIHTLPLVSILDRVYFGDLFSFFLAGEHLNTKDVKRIYNRHDKYLRISEIQQEQTWPHQNYQQLPSLHRPQPMALRTPGPRDVADDFCHYCKPPAPGGRTKAELLVEEFKSSLLLL